MKVETETTNEETEAEGMDLATGDQTEVSITKEIAELRSEIEALKADDQFRRPAASIDAGAGRTSPATLTKEALARMKPSEIAELDWSEVRRVLAA